MNASQWILLIILLIVSSLIAGVIGAYFETRKRPQKNDKNKDDTP
ncbi:MAG: hypothetical protein PHY28_08020 [Dehalococcoidales bacterium]|nr:hypothetical protein [Dehalococcoidales bacterium]